MRANRTVVAMPEVIAAQKAAAASVWSCAATGFSDQADHMGTAEEVTTPVMQRRAGGKQRRVAAIYLQAVAHTKGDLDRRTARRHRLLRGFGGGRSGGDDRFGRHPQTTGGGAGRTKVARVAARNVMFSILPLSIEGKPADPRVVGDRIVQGGQTIGFDGTKIVFRGMAGPPTIKQ